jgi:hypothetical protein
MQHLKHSAPYVVNGTTDHILYDIGLKRHGSPFFSYKDCTYLIRSDRTTFEAAGWWRHTTRMRKQGKTRFGECNNLRYITADFNGSGQAVRKRTGSEGLWRCCMTLRINGVLHFVRRPEFSDWGQLFLKDSTEQMSPSSHLATETHPCMIWGFHGGDYEECRLLGYKSPVRTSQETHYVSATESSQLMLCKNWGFHGSDHEECRLLGCYAVWIL